MQEQAELLYRELYVPSCKELDDLMKELESSTRMLIHDAATKTSTSNSISSSYSSGSSSSSSSSSGSCSCLPIMLAQHQLFQSQELHLHQQKLVSSALSSATSALTSAPSSSSPASAALEALLLGKRNTHREQQTLQERREKKLQTAERRKNSTCFNKPATNADKTSNTNNPKATTDDFSDMFRSVIAVENPSFDFPEIAWCTDDEEDLSNNSNSSIEHVDDDDQKNMTPTNVDDDDNAWSLLSPPSPSSEVLPISDNPASSNIKQDSSSRTVSAKRDFESLEWSEHHHKQQQSKNNPLLFRRSKTFRTELCYFSEHQQEKERSTRIPTAASISTDSTCHGKSYGFPKSYSDGLMFSLMDGGGIAADSSSRSTSRTCSIVNTPDFDENSRCIHNTDTVRLHQFL